MKIQWLGHSSFALEEAGKTILIDPFLSGNPAYPADLKIEERPIDAIVLTHGHGDHIGEAAELAKKNDATVFGIYEIVSYLEGFGVQKLEPMNTGGSVLFGDSIKVTLVNALHSASLIEEGGRALYMGVACGAVITGPTCTLYHAGDTDVFSDMALIQRIWRPDVGLLPIGDRFTMNPDTAALACNEFLDLKAVIPMHFDTFPLLTGKPDAFARQVRRGEVRILKPGEVTEFAR